MGWIEAAPWSVYEPPERGLEQKRCVSDGMRFGRPKCQDKRQLNLGYMCPQKGRFPIGYVRLL